MSEAEDVIALAEVEDKGRALALPEPGQALAYSKQLYGDWKTFIDSAIERARRAEQDGVAKKHAAASLLKAQQTSTPAAKLLITKSHGVAHLDQAVMIDQVQKQADVIDKQKGKNKGTDWFDIKTPKMTDELKRDLQLLKMRGVLDPKRHYRKDNSKVNDLPTTFQVGTIVAGATDAPSQKMARREQKRTIVEELLDDTERRAYFKRKAAEIDTQKRAGGKKFYKDLQSRRDKKRA